MLDAVPLPIQVAAPHPLTRADTSILGLDWVNSPAVGPCVSYISQRFSWPLKELIIKRLPAVMIGAKGLISLIKRQV